MRIWLRDVEDEDVVLFFAHQRDRESAEMAAFVSRDLEAHLAHWDKLRADPSVLARTIASDSGVAGNIVSWKQDDHREVGYWIDKRFWGRGVASEALRAFLGLEQERPLLAFVAEHNLGSIRVLEKCGFETLRTDRAEGSVHIVMALG